MTSIIASKVINVVGALPITPQLTISTNCIGFIPDECIVKQISYHTSDLTTTSSGVYGIRSNMINDIIGIFSPTPFLTGAGTYLFQTTINPNIHIVLKNGVNSNVTFDLLKFGGTLQYDPVILGYMSIVVEFIKHK